MTDFSKYTGSKCWHNILPQNDPFFTFPLESFKLYSPATQQLKTQTWTVESVILMKILFCAVQQTDRIRLPSATNRIEITNYSWTHERTRMKLHLKHQLSYNTYFALCSALKTNENLVNLVVLSSGKEKKEVKSSPTLTWLLLRYVKKQQSFHEPQNYVLT